ncbi:serine/threonine protein kinase [Desulfosudis oleivorans]|uniref:Serine/threonine protein kinase n=1 Tax=Desulfosudis oleivorans (strain DSM 6200 / JCM 39069 / Hxd3) TaxID=96561 RepID=A8ZW76_DESOH|nr:serine/threonine-protein kinase [Desulfosudis oleivorans]ABW68310.1 serine/threonine protein kinase [Desulfosudis oleivorans Hxd3]
MAKKPITFDTPFDTYTSSGVIGEGGAGRVYIVNNSAGKEYALKCLAPERINTERLKRFKNEMQYCQRNNHQNIIRLIDTGAIFIKDVKCPFYVMRRYSGTLRTIMGKLKTDAILPLFSQILDGIEAAHLAGVWHRDLKPENILYDQRKNRLVLADFGIAHFEEEEIYTAVETRIASRMANFQYSAPEQRTRSVKIDNRADIFPLGLILNEMFTGEILQGAGYKKISDTSGNHAYLDDLVEMMTQQNPANRPDSIAKIKMELIGRRNAFVALQKYDESKKQVVSAAEPPEFEPIQIVGLDYESGILKLQLNRNVPPGWEQEFQNPRGGHQFIIGYGPERFNIRGDTASIGIRDNESTIQKVVDHAKNYVAAANQGYIQQEKQRARQESQHKRAELERQIVESEKRKNILSNIKL